MKYLIGILFLISGFSANAQTNVRAVVVDTNGVLQKPTNFITANRIVSVETNGVVANPTNFWTANSNSINSVVVVSPYLSDRVFNRYITTFANLRTDVVNGSVSATNSFANAGINATNSSGKAALILKSAINNVAPAGVGTRFGADKHFLWIGMDFLVRENGLLRVVLGDNQNSSTNIAEYPTNRAIGFEITESGGTNQVRIIAHNGTTNTNGPWVAVGDFTQRYLIGVEQNNTNGEVKLYVAANAAAPTNNTNATITGGPTNNAPNAFSALSAGLFTTNTNAGNISFNISSAFVDVVD
jgi:hypothetical protein